MGHTLPVQKVRPPSDFQYYGMPQNLKAHYTLLSLHETYSTEF